MKPTHTVTLVLMALALTSCASPPKPQRPNNATSDAGYYLDIYQKTNYRGDSLRLQGPAEFSNLQDLSGRDWSKLIASVRTGPGCWAVLYEDERFRDTRDVIGPNSEITDLGNLREEIESIQLLDHAP